MSHTPAASGYVPYPKAASAASKKAMTTSQSSAAVASIAARPPSGAIGALPAAASAAAFPFELSSSVVSFQDYAPETTYTKAFTVRNTSPYSQNLLVFTPASTSFSVFIHPSDAAPAPTSPRTVASLASASASSASSASAVSGAELLPASKLGRAVTLAPGIAVRLSVKLHVIPSPAAAAAAAVASGSSKSKGGKSAAGAGTGAGSALSSALSVLSTLDTPPLPTLASSFLLAVTGGISGASDAAIRDSVSAAAAALATHALTPAALAAAGGPVRAVSLRAVPPASHIVFTPGPGLTLPQLNSNSSGSSGVDAEAGALLPQGAVCDLGAVLARHKGLLRVNLANLGARPGRWELVAEPLPPTTASRSVASSAANTASSDVSRFVSFSPAGGVLASATGAVPAAVAASGADVMMPSETSVTITFSPPADLPPGPCRALLRLIQTDDETEVGGGPLASSSLAERQRRLRAEAASDPSVAAVAAAAPADTLVALTASFVSQALQLYRPPAAAAGKALLNKTGAHSMGSTGAAAGKASGENAPLGALLSELDFGAVIFGEQKTVTTLLHNPTAVAANFTIQVDHVSVQEQEDAVPADESATTALTLKTKNGGKTSQSNASTGSDSAKSKAGGLSQLVVVPFGGSIPPFSSREVTFTFAPTAPASLRNSGNTANNALTHISANAVTALGADLHRSGPTAVSTEVSATAVVSSIDASAKLRLPLRATGIEPALSLVPARFDFGVCPVLERRDVAATLTNPSPHRALAFSFSSAAHFAVHPREGVLQPRQSVGVTLSYTPHNLGAHAGELPLTVAGGARVIHVPLTGRADGYSAAETAAAISGSAAGANDRAQSPTRSPSKSRTLAAAALSATTNGNFGDFSMLTTRAPTSPEKAFTGTIPRRPVPTGAGKPADAAPGPAAAAPLVPGHFAEAPRGEPISRSAAALKKEMARAMKQMRKADSWVANDNDAVERRGANGFSSGEEDNGVPVDRSSIGGMSDDDDDGLDGDMANGGEDEDTPEGRARAKERRAQLRRLQGMEPEATTKIVWMPATGEGAAAIDSAPVAGKAASKTGRHFKTGWRDEATMRELQRARDAHGEKAWEGQFTYSFAEAKAKLEHRDFYNAYLTQSRVLRAAANGTLGSRSPRNNTMMASAGGRRNGENGDADGDGDIADDVSLGMGFAEGLTAPQPRLPRGDPTLVVESFNPRALYSQTATQVHRERNKNARLLI